MKKISAGIIYMIIAAFFFSLMAICVKALKGSISSQQMVFARSVFLFAAGAAMVKFQGLTLWGRNKKLLFLRGFFGFLGLSAFFHTLSSIPIADSVVIQYTSPLFTALLAPYILKERSTSRQWLVYLMAFSGLLLIVKPGFSLHAWPALIGLAGAACTGVAYNLVRKLGQTENPYHIILYLPAVSLPLSLPATVSRFALPQGMEWLLLLFIGLFTFIAQIFLTRSLKVERAARATNTSYITIVFSGIFGYLIWGEKPDIFSASGTLLILLAIYLMARQRQ